MPLLLAAAVAVAVSRCVPRAGHVLSRLGPADEPRTQRHRVAIGTAVVACLVLRPSLLALAPVGLALPWVHRRNADQRAARAARAGLAPFLDATASAVRGGASLPGAIGAATVGAPPELARRYHGVLRAVDAGVSLTEAVAPVTGDDRDQRLAASTLALVARHGGDAARALDRSAAVLRERDAARRERRALAVQARASAVVLVVAPLGFALLTGLTDRRALDFLLGTPLGLACAVAGVGLDAAGAWWMHVLVRGDS